MSSVQKPERRAFLRQAGDLLLGLAALVPLGRLSSARAEEPRRLKIDDLARSRQPHLPTGDYDHHAQQLANMKGPSLTTSSGDEDAGGSTTYWDGEKS